MLLLWDVDLLLSLLLFADLTTAGRPNIKEQCRAALIRCEHDKEPLLVTRMELDRQYQELNNDIKIQKEWIDNTKCTWMPKDHPLPVRQQSTSIIPESNSSTGSPVSGTAAPVSSTGATLQIAEATPVANGTFSKIKDCDMKLACEHANAAFRREIDFYKQQIQSQQTTLRKGRKYLSKCVSKDTTLLGNKRSSSLRKRTDRELQMDQLNALKQSCQRQQLPLSAESSRVFERYEALQTDGPMAVINNADHPSQTLQPTVATSTAQLPSIPSAAFLPIQTALPILGKRWKPEDVQQLETELDSCYSAATKMQLDTRSKSEEIHEIQQDMLQGLTGVSILKRNNETGDAQDSQIVPLAKRKEKKQPLIWDIYLITRQQEYVHFLEGLLEKSSSELSDVRDTRFAAMHERYRCEHRAKNAKSVVTHTQYFPSVISVTTTATVYFPSPIPSVAESAQPLTPSLASSEEESSSSTSPLSISSVRDGSTSTTTPLQVSSGTVPATTSLASFEAEASIPPTPVSVSSVTTSSSSAVSSGVQPFENISDLARQSTVSFVA